MRCLKQERRRMSFNRMLTILGSFFVLAACALSIGAGLAFASLAEFAVTAEDFAEKKVYSRYAGRAYPDRVY